MAIRFSLRATKRGVPPWQLALEPLDVVGSLTAARSSPPKLLVEMIGVKGSQGLRQSERLATPRHLASRGPHRSN